MSVTMISNPHDIALYISSILCGPSALKEGEPHGHSPCGRFVAAVGTGFGQAQTVCVWSSPRGDWTDGAHLASAPCALRACAFLAFGTAACASAFDVCVGGVGAAVGTPDVVFLKLRGRNLVAADTCVPEGGLGAYLCGVCCGDALLAGTQGGNLEKWTQKSAAHAGLVTRVACETAHGGGASCATATTENRCVTGGADGWVKVWATADLQILNSYFLGEAPVRGVACDLKFLRVAATTAKALLHEVVTDSGKACAAALPPRRCPVLLRRGRARSCA